MSKSRVLGLAVAVTSSRWPWRPAARSRRRLRPLRRHRRRRPAGAAATAAAAAAARADAGARAPTEEELFAKMSLDELNAKEPLGDVFFPLDSSDLSDEARALLQKNADYLKRWTSTRVSVEGHCDERGTAEYNLGLGERRATAVKSYLVSLGVAADRLATVSKGKEQPTCTESNEGCWSQNRRGHFIFTGEVATPVPGLKPRGCQLRERASPSWQPPAAARGYGSL